MEENIVELKDEFPDEEYEEDTECPRCGEPMSSEDPNGCPVCGAFLPGDCDPKDFFVED